MSSKKKVKSAKKAVVASATANPETVRGKTAAVIKAELKKAKPAQIADRAWRQGLVAKAHKRTGLSLISCRSVMREIRA